MHNVLLKFAVFELKYVTCFIFQIFGALWYLFSLERIDTCWQEACQNQGPDTCNEDFLYCGNHNVENYEEWRNSSQEGLKQFCSHEEGGEEETFNFGIYGRAMESKVVYTRNFVDKFWFCLWWGLQNLR